MIFTNSPQQTCLKLKLREKEGIKEAYLGFADGELVVFAKIEAAVLAAENLLDKIERMEEVRKVKILETKEISDKYYESHRRKRRGSDWGPP